MKVKNKIIVFSIIAGIIVGGVDAIIDTVLFYEGPLLDNALFGLSAFEVYVRSLILVTFVIFGSIVSIIFGKREQIIGKLRLRSEIMKNMVEGVYLVRAEDGIIAYTNPKFEEMFGYGPGEMLGKHVSIVNAPSENTPEETAREITGALEKTGEWHGEVNNIKKDGTPFWCYANVSVFNHPGYGKVFVSVHTDITERKRAEKELKESEKGIRELMESLPIGVSVTTPKGEILEVNRTALDMFGYDERADFLSGPVTAHYYDKKDRELVIQHIKQEIRAPIEVRLKRRRGEAFWCAITTTPSSSKRRERIFINSLQDVTERKKIEEKLKKYAEELEESNRLKDLFTDIMRHDLVNPLNVVLTMGKMVTDKRASPKDREEAIGMVLRNTEKMERIIVNASKLAKIESIKKMEFQKMNLGKIMKNSIASIAPLAKEKNMSIESKLKGNYPVQATAVLGEVFDNLLSNAVKYSSDSKIEVKIEAEDVNWRVSVKDSGIGVPDKYKEEIFERFERRFKGGVKGSGLGLAIAKKVVELHSGRIWVEDNPGGGSVFCVEIPKAQR